MVIVTDANGNLVKNIPERIYQGSNNANSIVFMCPLATTAQAEISFVLANGEVTESFIMTPYDDTGDDTSGLGAWSFNLQRYITQYYGTVQYQIKVYTGVTESEDDDLGQIVATVGGSFEVLRGIPSIVPDTPSADVYEQILSYLASILTSLEGGEAKAVLEYDSTFAYSLNAIVVTSTAVYQSLVEDNVGHALNNTQYWAKYEFATPLDISELQAQINQKQDKLTFDATPTESSTNPVYSGGVYTSVSGLDSRITTNTNDINTIEGKIPAQASSSNQLADKDFVNSSINALAAYYMTRNAQGDPFQTKAQLDGTSTFYSGGQVRVPTTNDYCLVIADITQADSVTGYTEFTNTNHYVGYYVLYNNESTLVTHDNKDSVGITAGTTPCYYSIPTTRYSYQGNQWEFQYIVNTTSLTAEQLSALNSGITATLVNQITTNQGDISTLNTTKANNADVVHLAGAETITGKKTFSANIAVDSQIDIGTGAIKYSYNNINYNLNGTDIYLFASSTFQPNGSTNSNRIDLGGVNRYWKDIYLAGNLSDGTNSISVANIENKTDYTKVTALSGANAPTTSTYADFVGQIYITTAGKVYQCTAKTAQGTTPETYTYTWKPLAYSDDVFANYVSFSEAQVLTPEQQAQARVNIGAGSGSGGTEVYVNSVLQSTLSFDSDPQTQISAKVPKTTTIAGVDLQDNITKNELLTALNVEDGAEVNEVNDVEIDDVSCVTGTTAEIRTINGDYNASTNRLATNNDFGVKTLNSAPTTSTPADYIGQIVRFTNAYNGVEWWQCTDITTSNDTTTYTWTQYINGRNTGNSYNGQIYLAKVNSQQWVLHYPVAQNAGIAGRLPQGRQYSGVIDCTNINEAVKAALSDADHLTMTSLEQSTAQSVLGVNNPTITITQGGVTKGSFTLNQSSSDTIALDAGGGSDLPTTTTAGKVLTSTSTAGTVEWGDATKVTFVRWS